MPSYEQQPRRTCLIEAGNMKEKERIKIATAEILQDRRVPRSTVLKVGRALLQKSLNAFAAVGKRKAAVVQCTFNL